MNIGKYLSDTLNEQGRSKRWLALKIGMNEKTLSGKFSRGSFSAEDLVLIAEALDIDLNKLKGSSNSPAHYDVYKVYDEAIDNLDFNAIIKNIAIYYPELDENLRSALAAVISYMVECDITYEEFVELMCAEFWTVEEMLDNYYWFYPDIKTEAELTRFAKTHSKSDIILSSSHVFTERGCLVLCDPPFTKFVDGKLCYEKPKDE